MEIAQSIIGYITLVISIVMYAPQSFKVWKTKDTSALSKPTFIALYLGCIFWIVWSVMKHITQVWLTNVGIAVLMIPIIYYLFKDKKIYSLIMSAVIVASVVFAITYSVIRPEHIENGVDTNKMADWLSITLVAISSSLTSFCWMPQVIHVFKSKDTSSLSLISLSLILLNQTLLLGFYGMKIYEDSSDFSLYISLSACIIPNIFVGIIMGAKIFIKQPQPQTT